MKTRLLIGIFTFINVFNAIDVEALTVQIYLKQAKNLYNAMTGPSIQNEGAAGHLYRTGKSVVCIYTNVDMDDAQGHLIPTQDARRYECKMQFDHNGLASPIN